MRNDKADRTPRRLPEGEGVDDGKQGLVGIDHPDPVQAAHNRLVTGDPVASEELASLLLDPLVARLRRRWPRWQHSDVLHDAAVDVVLDYLQAPERYDPASGPLIRWLEVAAHRDLTNAYRSERQRRAIELVPLSAVGDPKRPPHEVPNGATPIGQARVAPDPANADRLDSLDIWRRVRKVCPERRERELIWACWVEGERSTEELAKILDVDHLPVEQRRRRVKDARDVARRKLLRMGLIDDDLD
jgi:RNA polymerase sigma-70 factor (ECF subfamily)